GWHVIWWRVAPVSGSAKVECSEAETAPFIFCHHRGRESDMRSVQTSSPELITGQRMTREEFLCRWEALPDLKNAELIDGVVYVASPVSIEHGTSDISAHAWLELYAWHTP